MTTLISAIVQPHITYCIPIWGSTYPTHLQKVFLLQKKAIRIITNSHFLEHTQPLFKSVNILNLYDTIKLEIGCYMYKNINTHEYNRAQHNYNTRYRHDVRTPAHHLSSFENSLSFNGPLIWNKIPQDIKNKPSVQSFRNSYKKYLLSVY